MDPELLRKCLSGNASEEELEIYEKWMEGEDDDLDAEELIQADMPLQSEVWAKIGAQNLKHDYSRLYKNQLFKIAVAASLLAVLCFFAFQNRVSPNHFMVFHYDHSRPLMEQEFDGLRIRLGQNGMVKLAQQANTLDISFSGNVMLSNTTAADKEILVVSKNNGGQAWSKKINLRKGRSYLLAHYIFKEDELVMVENHNLIDMPPALAINMKRDFNL